MVVVDAELGRVTGDSCPEAWAEEALDDIVICDGEDVFSDMERML